MAKKKIDEIQKKVSVRNRKASHEYSFIDTYVAGIVLRGTEIKSIRMGKVNLQDAFAMFINGELWLRNLNITPYSLGTIHNHEAKADRKLLLQKRELAKIEKELEVQGITIVPTHLFTNDRGYCKVEIAIAKGKKLYDKRDDIKQKDIKRDLDRIKF